MSKKSVRELEEQLKVVKYKKAVLETIAGTFSLGLRELQKSMSTLLQSHKGSGNLIENHLEVFEKEKAKNRFTG